MLSQSYYIIDSRSESDSSQSHFNQSSRQSDCHLDHSYGQSLDKADITLNKLNTSTSTKAANIYTIETMEDLFPDILNDDYNDDNFSLGNAPTPYLAEGMHDFSDISDSDLVRFESTNNAGFAGDIVDYVNNEIVIDNGMNDSLVSNVVGDATHEQIQFSVTHDDIIHMNDNTTDKRVTRRKRRIEYEETDDEDDDDEPVDDQPSESIALTNHKKSKKYVRQQNGGRSTTKANKCMTRNAIAARENREKKKQYIKSIERELAIANKEIQTLRANVSSTTERNNNLEREVAYYKAIVANIPQITALIDHMSMVPNVKLIGTSFTANEQVLEEPMKKAAHSTDNNNNAVRKSHRIAAKVESAGICFHISNNNMSLELCNKCSEASKKFMKIKKEK